MDRQQSPALSLARREFLTGSLAAGAALAMSGEPGERTACGADIPTDKPLEIGSRRELFVDDYLLESLQGQVERRLQTPQPRELSLVHDAPWEGSGSGYHSVFADEGRFRMYYKAWHLDLSTGKLRTNVHPLYCCYAESTDGVRWTKPALGLVEFNGSKDNNIVVASGPVDGLDVDAGHPAVCKDENPAAPAESRYKALFRSPKPHGLLAFHSPDGLRWKPMHDKPVITDGAFDSQNLAFWDGARGEYRAYWRYFTEGTTDEKNWKPAGVRAIRTATSPDFVHWSQPVDLSYVDSPPEQLYTNQIKPYHRAPHLLLGFPTRYVDRGWSESMRALPELEHRELRAKASPRYGTAVTEGLFMASRDRVKFHRWNEAFLRPGIQRPGTWQYGQQYIAWHLLETKSELEGAPPELSLYAGESYWTGTSSALRRYTLRLDGFVAVHAGARGGELRTRPFTFAGDRLSLNFATSAAGSVRVEIQDVAGKALPGFALDDCHDLFGDSVDRTASWKNGAAVGSLAGKPVRLRFELRDADLFALQFGG